MSRAGSVRRDDFQPGFSTNDHSANDVGHLFPVISWLFLLDLCSWMGYFTSTSYLEGGTLIFSSDIVLG